MLGVRQKSGESTRDYITRFNNEKLEVIDYEEKTAITALMSGLLPNKLYYTLAKDPPKTMSELMAKAAKIMNAEEAMAAKNNTDTKENKVEAEKTEKKDQKNNGGNRQSKEK